MTSLIAWVGIDARGPASIYVASDSRVTWGDDLGRWDCAKKTFCSLRHPIVFGFCGDAFVPTQIIAGLMELIDRDIVLLSGDAFHKTATIKSAIENMQSEMRAPEMKSYSILIGYREGEGMRSRFDAAKITFDRNRKEFSFECIDLYGREKSFLIFADGSGAETVFSHYDRWEKTSEGRTSRAVYGAFCDALTSGVDGLSGGAPQIVGLYRIGVGNLFGTLFHERLYIAGKPVASENLVEVIEWRDHLFQRIDPTSKSLLQGAQRHTGIA